MAVTDVRNIPAVRLRALRLRAVRLRAVRLDDRNKRSSVMLSVRNGTTVRFQEATTAARFSNVTGCLCPHSPVLGQGRDFIMKSLPRAGFRPQTGMLYQLTDPSRRNSLDVQLTSDRILSMAKTLIQSVVKQLQQERARLENELRGVTAALTTFGKVFLRGSKRGPMATHKKRTISAAGRKR